MTERAVSNLLGFVLIFSVIVSGAGMALVIGESGLDDIRTFEQQENAERAFVLLGQNFAELEYSRAATVSGTLDLNDGQLRYQNDSSVDVSVGTGTGNGEIEKTIPMGSLAYEIHDTTVRYQSGQVIRSDGGNGVQVSEPRFRCGDDAAFISIVTLDGDADQQYGSGTIRVSARQRAIDLAYPVNRTGAGSAGDGETVTMEIDSQHQDVWERHLTEGNWEYDEDDEEYECDDVDSVHVRQTVANVSFGR